MKQTVYFVIKATMSTRLTTEQALKELDEQIIYDLGNTTNVKLKETEMLLVTHFPVTAPLEFIDIDPEDEYITHEKGDKDAWVCICGNMPCSAGFDTCDPQGNEMEATIGSGWNGTYLCGNCNRIVDQNTLKVIGRRKEEEPPTT